MMKSPVTLGALAGLTAAATAQNIATVTLTSSAATVAVGETFTISVILSDNIAGNSVFAFDVEVTSSGTLGIGGITNPVPDAGIFGFAGSATATGATGLGGSSDILGPDLDPSLDGVAVYSFQATATSSGSRTFTAMDGAGPNAAVQWGEGGSIVINPRDYDQINFGSVTVRAQNMVRTPITIAALAGLTTVATAQTVGTVTLTTSASTAPIGGVFTIGVVLSDNISGNSVFAFDLMIEGFGPGIALPSDPVPDAGIFGFNGSVSGNAVTGLGGSSDILGPTLDASLDGVTVFTFQVTTAITCGVYEFSVADGPGPGPAMQWGEEGGIVINPRDYDQIVFNSVSVPPMQTAISIAALAGLTTAAAAQTVGTVTLTASTNTALIGETFTIGVVLSDNIDGPSVFAFDLAVTGSGAAFSTLPDSLVGDPSASGFVFGFTGQINPDGAQAFGQSNDILGPTLDAPLDDLAVFTFQVLATQSGTVTFNASDGDNLSVNSMAHEHPCIVLCPDDYDQIVFEGLTITVRAQNMVRTPITIAALAGLTTVATAQTVGTVTLTISAATIALGETFTIGAILTDNISGNSVFGFDLNIEVELFGMEITLADPVADPGIFGFSGSSSPTAVTGLGGSSDILGPDLDPSLDGVTVFTFQVTIDAITHPLASADFSVADGPGPNAAMQWGEGGGIVINPREFDELVFNGVSFRLPAPGTASLLAGAALLATRRRR
eukprot:g5953.t1